MAIRDHPLRVIFDRAYLQVCSGHGVIIVAAAVATAALLVIGYSSIRSRLQGATISPPDADATLRDRQSRRSRRAREKSAVTQGLRVGRMDEPQAKPRASATMKQPYDAFLVLDVEGTCETGSGMDWPNEIIASSF